MRTGDGEDFLHRRQQVEVILLHEVHRLFEAEQDGACRMGIRREDDGAPCLSAKLQNGLRRVGRCTVSPRDGTGVEFEYSGGLEKTFERVVLRFSIPRVRHVDEVVPLDELRDEVDVRDDVAAGLRIEVPHQCVIIFHKGHGVPAIHCSTPRRWVSASQSTEM